MEDPKNTKPRRRLRWITLAVFGILIAVLAVLFLADVSPPDESPMKLDQLSLAQQEPNAISEFARKHTVEITAFDEEFSTLLNAGSPLPAWEAGWEEDAENLISKYGAVLEGLDHLAKTEQPLRWPGISADMNLTTLSPAIHEIQSAFKLAQIEVRHLAASGEVSQAVAKALVMTRLADQLMQTEGSLIHWLVAITTLSIAGRLA